MEMTGKVHAKFDEQQVSERFRKREFVLEYVENPMYPQYILFQLIQDNVSKLDQIKEGDSVRVTFNIKGRSWTSPQGETRYFNSLDAYDIKVLEPEVAGAPPPSPPPEVDGDDDDLPF